LVKAQVRRKAPVAVAVLPASVLQAAVPVTVLATVEAASPSVVDLVPPSAQAGAEVEVLSRRVQAPLALQREVKRELTPDLSPCEAG
jgi:hypothetical protein